MNNDRLPLLADLMEMVRLGKIQLKVVQNYVVHCKVAGEQFQQ
jgi:hypothetical protein